VNRALISGHVEAREVLVENWHSAAEGKVGVRTSHGVRFKAAAGILATQPIALKVIGAWIRDGMIVDECAKDRGSEIHLYGYT
jgi:hypothetical protein